MHEAIPPLTDVSVTLAGASPELHTLCLALRQDCLLGFSIWAAVRCVQIAQGRAAGRQCLRSRMIMSTGLCWEDLTEPQVILENTARACSAEQLGALRFAAK